MRRLTFPTKMTETNGQSTPEAHVIHQDCADIRRPLAAKKDHQRATAKARPAIRPVNKQPPKKVPSKTRLPWAPPPPNPAPSPTAYTPGSGEPAGRSTRPSRSVSK